MKIKELIEALEKCDKESNVYFDFGGCIPTTIGSWRWSYSEPALGWGCPDETKSITVQQLITELTTCTTKTYYGWKGGSYIFGENQDLWIDNPGQSTETAVSGLKDLGHEVLILTEYTEY